MSSIAPVLPYLFDPVGAALNVPYSPGGALQNAITPSRPQPQAPPAAAPAFTMPTLNAPAGRGAPPGPQVPAASPIPPGDKTGAGPGADVTRGLLASRSKRTLLG